MDKTDRIPSLIKHVVLVYDKAWFEVWERGEQRRRKTFQVEGIAGATTWRLEIAHCLPQPH